jgi:CBS domain containing-hemolysin-like protein
MDNPAYIILLSMLMCAFFSGIEIAFITASKLRIELKSKQGSYTARILSQFVKEPSKFISTTLIGNNIALVIYSIYMDGAMSPLVAGVLPYEHDNEFLVLLITTIVSTAVVLIFAEFIPKALFRINPDVILFMLTFPFMVFYYLLWPVVHFIVYLSKFVFVKIFRLEFSESTPVFSKIDLDNYINESAKLDLDEDADIDTEMFRNALDFANVKVRDCMVPRTELVAIEVTDTIENLYSKFLESGHSKILVYHDSIDNVIGYVHQVEMFKKPKSIRTMMISPVIATETMQANELLKLFSTNKKSVALVVDEFGGTAGMVTIEDIMEEIFGEIEDEYDVEKLTEQKVSDTEFVFSARLEIDYLNREYDLNIPEGEYTTLGGFIIEHHESLPHKDEKIQIGPYEFTILSVFHTRINEVRMKKV